MWGGGELWGGVCGVWFVEGLKAMWVGRLVASDEMDMMFVPEHYDVDSVCDGQTTWIEH
jgi:hypothetical protein